MNYVSYIIFSLTTGQILRTITSTPDQVDIQKGQNEEALISESFVDDSKLYVDLNTLTLIEYPLQPSSFHQFNYTTHQWFDPRTDLQLRDAKWEEVKQWRENALNSPLTWNSYVFDADQKGQTNLKGAAQLAQFALVAEQPFTTTFTLADNTDVTLTAMEILMVGVALGVRTEQCYARGRELREVIYDPLTSVEDLEGLQWENS